LVKESPQVIEIICGFCFSGSCYKCPAEQGLRSKHGKIHYSKYGVFMPQKQPFSNQKAPKKLHFLMKTNKNTEVILGLTRPGGGRFNKICRARRQSILPPIAAFVIKGV
jgi:hypothetical protein